MFFSTCVISLLDKEGPLFPQYMRNLGALRNLQFPEMTTVSPAEGKSELTMTGRTCLSFQNLHPVTQTIPDAFPEVPALCLTILSVALLRLCQINLWFRNYFLPKKLFFYYYPTHIHTRVHTNTHTHHSVETSSLILNRVTIWLTNQPSFVCPSGLSV